MYIAIANAIYSSLLQGSRGGFPQACFGLDYNAITSDFTFTRNSFATRVNEFGLIETVTNLGSDLVQNGSFDELGSEQVTNGNFDTDSDWNLALGHTIENGVLKINSTSYKLTTQPKTLTIGKTYKVTFDVLNYVSGRVEVGLAGSDANNTTSSATSNGSYEFYVTRISGGTNNISIITDVSSELEIDNVSVKQVDPNDEWSLTNGATISNGQLNIDYNLGNGSTTQTNVFTIGKTYKIEINVDNSSIGVVRINNGVSATVLSNGLNTFYLEAVGTTIEIRNHVNFIGSIDNISVKEVLEDDVPRIDYTGSTFDVPVLGDELIDYSNIGSPTGGWSLVNGKWFFDDTTTGYILTESFDVVVGEQYEVTVDVSIESGNANFRVTSGNAQTRLFNYTDFPNGVTKFITTVEGVDGVINRIFAPTSLTDNPFTLNSISIKKVTAYTTTDKGAFLLEPISTNLAIYSEDASQGILSNCTVQSGFISPEGNLTAYKLIEDSSNSIKLFRAVNNSSSTINTSYSSSIFVKKGERTKVRVYGYHLTNQYFYVDYDLTDNSYLGSFGQNSQVDGYAIEDIGDNGWKRITIIGQKDATYSWDVGVSPLNDNGDVSYLGDGVSGLYIWGAQMEELPYATSYIPTSGTTVTRAQESCVDATPTINSEEGVLYAEISALANEGTNRSITLNSGSSSNRVYLSYATGSNRLRIILNNSSGTQVDKTQTISSITNLNKIAFKYKENDFALWVNGVEVYTDTLGVTFPQGTLTELDFNNGSGSSIFYGRTKDLRVYCKALTDEQLIELTTI